LYYLRTFLPEYRKSVRGIYHKLLKTINILNGTLIANRRVPVMNRLLENSPASPKREDTRQEQTPTSGPEKGINQPGKSRAMCGG
jgi:hypothetical protein